MTWRSETEATIVCHVVPMAQLAPGRRTLGALSAYLCEEAITAADSASLGKAVQGSAYQQKSKSLRKILDKSDRPSDNRPQTRSLTRRLS